MISRRNKIDEYGRFSIEEFSDAMKSLTDALNRYSVCGYDALYDAIASLSSIEFADKDIEKLIDTQTDDIAVKLIVWRW